MHCAIVTYVAQIKSVKNIPVELFIEEAGLDEILPESRNDGAVLLLLARNPQNSPNPLKLRQFVTTRIVKKQITAASPATSKRSD